MARKSTAAVAAEEKAAAVMEEKTAPKKAPVKKTAVKKADEVKEEVPAEAAPEEAPVKKAAAEPRTAVIFEYADKKIVAKELLEKATSAFKASHPEVDVQDIQLYVNADEGCAYIVVNGVEYPEDKVEF